MIQLWKRVVRVVAGAACGGWMLFDGLHVLQTGRYIGPERPGPWADLVEAAGVDPFALGPLFVGVGLLWLGYVVLELARQPLARKVGRGAALLTLWYVPVGSLLALGVLALLRGGPLPDSMP